MKRNYNIFAAIMLSIFFIACGSKSDSPEAIAKEWCELNGKTHNAPEGAEKEAARQKQKDFEKSIADKHKDDKAFMDEVEKEVNKCEAASEGR